MLRKSIILKFYMQNMAIYSVNENLERLNRLEAEGFDIEKVIKRAAEIRELTAEQIQTAGKEP